LLVGNTLAACALQAAPIDGSRQKYFQQPPIRR